MRKRSVLLTIEPSAASGTATIAIAKVAAVVAGGVTVTVVVTVTAKAMTETAKVLIAIATATPTTTVGGGARVIGVGGGAAAMTAAATTAGAAARAGAQATAPPGALTTRRPSLAGATLCAAHAGARPSRSLTAATFADVRVEAGAHHPRSTVAGVVLAPPRATAGPLRRRLPPPAAWAPGSRSGPSDTARRAWAYSRDARCPALRLRLAPLRPRARPPGRRGPKRGRRSGRPSSRCLVQRLEA